MDDYADATNLLSAPLPRGASVRIDDWPYGRWYVTVIRQQRPVPGSPLIALTTQDPVPFATGLSVLLVFDTSFRLLDPVDNRDATPTP